MATGLLNELFPAGYPSLRRAASGYLRNERREHTLEPAALVNEAYLALSAAGIRNWDGMAHVTGAASLAMRRILVNEARARMTAKRGALAIVPMPDYDIAVPESGERARVREALADLRSADPALARVVELRCFIGLSVDEVAAELGVSTASVRRRWASAACWLRSRLGGGEPRRLCRVRAC